MRRAHASVFRWARGQRLIHRAPNALMRKRNINILLS